ncbi:MAG: DNA translocase FtsK [Firmicutes bacterium]|nr:DNA translocase FtsK [Bacillota bacterium]
MAEKKKNVQKKSSPKDDRRQTKKKLNEEAVETDLRKKREIQGIVITAAGIFLAIALFFNVTGALGEVFDRFFKGCFGHAAYVLPVYLILYGVLMLAGRTKIFTALSTVFFILLFFDISIVNSVRFVDVNHAVIPVLGMGDIFTDGANLENGGLAGMLLATLLVKIIGAVGSYIAAAVIAVISLIIISDRPIAGKGSWNEERMRRAKRQKTQTLPEPEKKLQEEELLEPAVPKGYTVPDSAHTKKAIRKANLCDNQKRILEYMTDDSLHFGTGGNEHVEGFGLDGSQESLSSGCGIGEGYDDGAMGRGPLDIYTGSYDNFVSEQTAEVNAEPASVHDVVSYEEKPEKETKVVKSGQTDPVRNVEKMSNTEAKNATLDKSEFNRTKAKKKYKFPPSDLLKKVEVKGADLADLAAKTKKLEETLEAFHVDAKVIAAVPGPAVTRYEIQPGTGVKVSSITKLSDDIALNLRAKSIRIEAPIPGKAAVGIEIENDKVNMVTIREIIDSREFRNAKSKISFAVGKDIAGKPIIGDLKGMPHLLIAGSTGSGKSVCINSIIASILYKATPDEVKLVLIDPKVVELGNYNGIPHLLIPVVTEPPKAAAALNWAVSEMNDRYKKFAEAGVRDLESYNEHVLMMDEPDNVMPQVVIIIDELADLMMAAPSQVEESICRLAQMARAAGMHLIVATQRPSVDVITGVIKANIPSRIAFAVSSQFDSRTILDMSGAEKLVGKGDMLYNPLGMGKPVRVQGTFISDNEVNSIIEFVKSQTDEVEYSNDVLTSIENTDQVSQNISDDTDELMNDCIEFVVASGQASVSMLQRRFRIGYNRAARIMDMMEAAGIVGPQDGSRPRQVLLNEAELKGEEPADSKANTEGND